MTERQHPDERDVDAIFESIVARWDEDADEAPTDGGGPAPAAAPDLPRRQSTGDVRLPAPDDGDEPDRTSERGPAPSAPEPVPWRTDPTNSVADALLGDDDLPGDADDDEGFTPPPTAPLPPLSDRLFWGALLGLVLGPLGLLWLVLTRTGGWWPTAIATGLVIGGFTCLVLRQPTDRGHDPDQGARV